MQPQHQLASGQLPVVLSGTYRRDPEGLRQAYVSLRDYGCDVLSPSSIDIISEHDGFVYMKGETTELPEAIEARHLAAIERSRFVWLFSPNGYVGPSAALEIGFARASGIPVFTASPVTEPVFRPMVSHVRSVSDAIAALAGGTFTIPSAFAPLQHYYRRVAIDRGYAHEDAKACLMLLVEEIGELARALRKEANLPRHHQASDVTVEQEIADVILYLIHMANITGVSINTALHRKEEINHARWLASNSNGSRTAAAV